MSLNRIHARNAHPDDVQALARIHYLSHTESFREFAPQGWIESRSLEVYLAYWESLMRDQGQREITWTIWFEERLVGTVTIMELRNSSPIFRPVGRRGWSENQICCLRLMYVHPDFLRQGLGRKLMSSVRSFMDEAGFQLGTLITHAANQRARGFYESQGWQLDEIFTAQVEEFFPEPIEMRKRARYTFALPSPGDGNSAAGRLDGDQEQ